jgi:uncharacterized membrane protein
MTGWKSIALGAVLGLSLLGNALALGAGLKLYHLREGLLGGGGGITLPTAERRALGAALAAHQGDLQPALHAVQAARGAAAAAILARPFDRARVATALDDLRLALDALMQQGQVVVLDDLARRNP